ERIVGDLGPGGRDHREQGALPGIRLPQQADIGDELEHELDAAFLTGLPWLPLTGTAVCGRREAGIAAAAPPATRHEDAVAGTQHLAQQRARLAVVHLRPRRNGQDQVRARLPRHVFPFPVLPTLRLPGRAVAVVEERGEVGIGAHVHAASGSTVATIGAALGDELFAAEGAGTRAPGTRHDVNRCAIYEKCDATLQASASSRRPIVPRPCVCDQNRGPTPRSSAPTRSPPLWHPY